MASRHILQRRSSSSECGKNPSSRDEMPISPTPTDHLNTPHERSRGDGRAPYIGVTTYAGTRASDATQQVQETALAGEKARPPYGGYVG